MTSQAARMMQAAARTCRLVDVPLFDAQKLIADLLAGRGCESDFRLLESSLSSSSITRLRVVGDEDHVYAGVLLWESLGFGKAAKAKLETAGAGQNVVEVIWTPWNDGVGFLQYGAGPAHEMWFNSHWPYRDERQDLAARPHFEVDWHVRAYGEDVARIAIFKFRKNAIFTPGATRIGLNVMRSELRNEENSAWASDASSFSDPTCTGLLLLDDSHSDQPSSENCVGVTGNAGREDGPSDKQPTRDRPFALAVTYDFPDEALNAPYTPEMLRREMSVLRDAGVKRIDWIDYPFWCQSISRLVTECGASDKSLPYRSEQIDFARQTCKAFGGDILGHASMIARELGFAFHVVIKPFDLWPKWTMPHETLPEPASSLNGRHVAWGDPFLEAHGDRFAFATNPEWRTKTTGPITQLVLWSDNDEPIRFNANDIVLWISDDNVTYRKLPQCDVKEGVETRQRLAYSPGFTQSLSEDKQQAVDEQVRCIRLTNLEITARYLAIETPECHANHSVSSRVFPCDFGNQRFALVQAFGPDASETPVTVGWSCGQAKRDRFEFNYSSNKAEWACVTEAAQRRTALTPGVMLPVALAHDEHMAGMLDPTFIQVQDYWLEHYIQRAIDVKADGVDVRIAQHQGCSNWLDYGWAAPVLQAFEAQFGRAPRRVDKDYQAMRRIRGQAYTTWLGRCKSMLDQAGMTLEHHLEARMVAGPEHDTYLQIHWDWQKWLDDGLVDGLNLKYLSASHPWIHAQVLPRARRHGAGVRVIDAPLDPRNHPRVVESHVRYMEIIEAAGLDGLSLYEAWTYLRTTPEGDLLLRGSAGPIFKQFALMLAGSSS